LQSSIPESCKLKFLIIAVLAIVITAPLGAVEIKYSGERWLSKGL
jgi:hypothetical protein